MQSITLAIASSAAHLLNKLFVKSVPIIPETTPSICIVESPADVWIVDQATVFKGHYFVLHGRLSPLDGIGPDELGLDLLEQRLATGTIKELILATNSTVEGEATAYFIGEMARKHQVQASRIAHGVPMGGELGVY